MPAGPTNQSPIATDDEFGGGGPILFVSDSTSNTGIADALEVEGYTVERALNDFQGDTNPTLSGDLSEYSAVYWVASGREYGSQHNNPALFENLNSYVSNGGNVFVTGYDSVASPYDPSLIQFLGGISSDDFGGVGSNVIGANSLTTGFRDIVGVRPAGVYSDTDTLFLDPTGGTNTQVVVESGSRDGGASWTLRQLGSGEIAYVSNGDTEGPWTQSWGNTGDGPFGAYNAALLNFAHAASGGGTVNANRVATLDVADLLRNDSDPDSDALSITAVAATSALGATVTLNDDGTITYDPTGVAALQAQAEDVAQNDSFTYTLSDGFGGESTGTVATNVAGPDGDPVVSGTLDGLSGYHSDDFSYQIDRDLITDLSGGYIRYDVTLADGAALPAWLQWDANSRTISFDDAAVDEGLIGSYALRITGTENDGQSVQTFTTLHVVGGLTIDGTAGADLLEGLAGPDTLRGFNDDDTITGGASDDLLEGGLGFDLMSGDDGDDSMGGGEGDDTLDGGLGNDLVNGGGDNDSIMGGAGADELNGMTGNDTLEGGLHDDTIGGQDGNDLLMGNDGHDFLGGGAGNDTLLGDDNKDVIYHDSLHGGDGDDVLIGGGGNDDLYGDAGNDLLVGGYGFDSLFGGDGDDFIFGGLHNDTATGGEGADYFFVSEEGGDKLHITDYNAAEGDRLVYQGEFATRDQFTLRRLSTLDSEGNVENLNLYLELDGHTLFTFDNPEAIDQIILRLPIADPTIAGDVVTFDLF